MEKLHPMSKKHFDQWTNADQPDRTTSFRDLIVYRLAETYLMCAEAISIVMEVVVQRLLNITMKRGNVQVMIMKTAL